MTPGNFDWFLHTMLFYHTRHVLERQKNGANTVDHDDNSDEEDVQNVQNNG